MRKITPDSLPTTRPDGPGYYRRDFDGKPVAWLSWWNPPWPHPAQPDGSYRSPLDVMQLTIPQEGGEHIHPEAWEFHAAHGVRVLGAREVQNAGYRLTLANTFLQKQEQEGNTLAKDERALRRLTDALETHGRLLRDRLSELPCHVVAMDPEYLEQAARDMPDFSGAPYTLGGTGLPGEADNVLATMLEHIGPKGRELAASVRKGSAERQHKLEAGEISLAEAWLPWLPDPDDNGRVRRHEALVVALWHDVVCRGLDNAPAVSRAVLQASLSTYYGRSPLPRHTTLGITVQRTPDGQEVESIDVARREALTQRLGLDGPVTDGRILDALASKVSAARSMTGQALLRHLFAVGHKRKKVECLRDFRAYTVVGGMPALIREIGRPDDGHERGLLRDALDGYELARIELPMGGHDGLLTWSDRRAAPGRKAEVQIILKDPLLPDYNHHLPHNTPADYEDRRLVPVPSRLPPMKGDRASNGSKMLLQWLTLEALSAGWREYETAGVYLPERAWADMGERVGLTRAETREARDTFVTGTPQAAPFLQRRPGDRFTLGDAYLAEERVILESARIRTSAATRQRAIKARRAK